MARPVRWGFVLRGGALALVGLAVAAWAALRLLFPPVPYAEPPAPPDIGWPAGEPPAGPAALQLWLRSAGEGERLAGSAFVLALPGGGAVGVTAAHNLASLESDGQPISLELRIAIGPAAESDPLGAPNGNPDGELQSAWVVPVAGLLGEPGRPRRFGLDLSTDHALLKLATGTGTGLALEADPRGGAQPGERILLLAGTDGARHAGTVFQAGEDGIWCLMDEWFEPGLLSGSPAFSLHTGRLVGMALAAGRREGRLVIGLHPIGPLLALAEARMGSR